MLEIIRFWREKLTKLSLDYLSHSSPLPIGSATIGAASLWKPIEGNSSTATIFALEKSFHYFDGASWMALLTADLGSRNSRVLALYNQHKKLNFENVSGKLLKNWLSILIVGNVKWNHYFHLRASYSCGLHFKCIEHFCFHLFFPLHFREIFMTLLYLKFREKLWNLIVQI